MAVEVRRHPAHDAGLQHPASGVLDGGRRCLATVVDCLMAVLPLAGIVVAVALPFAAFSFAQCRVARAQSMQETLYEQIRLEKARGTKLADDLQATLRRETLMKMAADAGMHEAGTPLFLGNRLP